MKFQGKSRRRLTGAKRTASHGKRKYELGREAAETHINETKRKNVATAGGNRKVRLMQCNVVNVTDPANGNMTVTSIDNVIDNAANGHYVRRNIITKGSIITTGLGDAKVTSRPGQDGVVNAMLIN